MCEEQIPLCFLKLATLASALTELGGIDECSGAEDNSLLTRKTSEHSRLLTIGG